MSCCNKANQGNIAIVTGKEYVGMKIINTTGSDTPREPSCLPHTHTRVVSQQDGLSSGWSRMRVVFHQGGPSAGWSVIRVVSYEGGVPSGWSLNRMVFHQGGLL